MVISADDPLNLLQTDVNAIAWRSEEDLASNAFVADLYSERIIHWITRQNAGSSPDARSPGASQEAIVRSWFD